MRVTKLEIVSPGAAFAPAAGKVTATPKKIVGYGRPALV